MNERDATSTVSDRAVAAPGASGRVESIDVLRGVTILLMIFVNDIAGVTGTPAWMKHVSPPDADGMTFVDVVFPAFLFIVGMSMPFSIARRLERGCTPWSLWPHVLIRTLGLLTIGVFMVNSGSVSDEGMLNPHVWTLLMYAAVILVWNTPPRESGTKRRVIFGLRVTGLGLLAVMAVLYRGNSEPGLIEIRPYWWGILGLIGWAYLVSCAAFIPLRHRPAGLVGVMALLYCVYMASSVGFFSGLTWITRWVDIGSMWGSLAAVTLSGVILGQALTPDSPVKTHRTRIRWAFAYAFGLAAAGTLLHSLRDIHDMFIINKIFATPPWCLWSSAITVWVWIVIYWVMDVRGWKRWAVAVEPAGNNALFAYILAPILYSVFALLATAFEWGNFYDRLGGSFATGFWRSLVFAFAVTGLAGTLRRVGVQLKL